MSFNDWLFSDCTVRPGLQNSRCARHKQYTYGHRIARFTCTTHLLLQWEMYAMWGTLREATTMTVIICARKRKVLTSREVNNSPSFLSDCQRHIIETRAWPRVLLADINLIMHSLVHSLKLTHLDSKVTQQKLRIIYIYIYADLIASVIFWR